MIRTSLILEIKKKKYLNRNCSRLLKNPYILMDDEYGFILNLPFGYLAFVAGRVAADRMSSSVGRRRLRPAGLLVTSAGSTFLLTPQSGDPRFHFGIFANV
jgi:hypothetical protein